jgi:hypothetical protein
MLGIPEGLCLSDAMQNDRSVLRDGMDLGVNDVALRMVLRESEGHVRGKVTDDAGNKVVGSVVALVPEERAVSEMYATGTTDQNGDFDLACIRPGNFRLYAWREMEGAAYRNPEFMKDNDASGLPVHIGKGDSLTQNFAVKEN